MKSFFQAFGTSMNWNGFWCCQLKKTSSHYNLIIDHDHAKVKHQIYSWLFHKPISYNLGFLYLIHHWYWEFFLNSINRSSSSKQQQNSCNFGAWTDSRFIHFFPWCNQSLALVWRKSFVCVCDCEKYTHSTLRITQNSVVLCYTVRDIFRTASTKWWPNR